LLAKRWVSLRRCWMCHRHREQARSHTGSSENRKFVFGTDSLWERACSRWRQVSLPGCWMCRPLRGQTRSHTGFSADKKLVFGTDPSVGAKLARDSGVSACLDVGCTAVIASRLAPTLDLQWARNLCSAQIPCGSELARDSGVSACLDVGCAAVIASRLAPTLDFQRTRNLCSAQIPLWEQSLLAMAGVLNVRAPSRASLAPTWVPGVSRFGDNAYSKPICRAVAFMVVLERPIW
jgi:hypothetical protein